MESGAPELGSLVKAGLLLSFLLGLLGPEARGQEISASQPEAKAVLKLSLREAVALAVRNNLELRTALIDEQIAQAGVREALGVFDPTFFSNLSGGQTESLFAANFPLNPSDPASPTVTRIISTQRQIAALDVGVRGRLDTGLSYDLTFSNNFRDERFGSGLNPIHTDTATLNLTQPLLRDAWSLYQDAERDKAHIRSRQAHQDWRRSLSAKVREVQGNYVDLLFAQQDLLQKERSIQVSDEQIKVTRLRVRLGSLAPTELTAALSERARRQADQVSAQAEVERAQDQLRRQILDFDEEGSWERSLVATDPVDAKPVRLLGARQIRILAEAGEPEVLRARLEVALRKRELDQRDAERRPRLDLSGNVSTTGLNDDFFRSWDIAFGQKGAFNWNAGLNFEMSLGNRTAGARRVRATLALKKAKIQLRNQQVELMFQIRRALREVRVAWLSIEAREEARRLADQQHRDELLRLKTGQSTNFQVSQVEDELRTREREKTRALLDYRLALLDLVRVTGLPMSRMIDPRGRNSDH